MSLWGSKKNPDTDEGIEENGHSGDMPSRSREPNERDRLLPANPRPPHNDGYLDPDDPAVCICFSVVGSVMY
jgi:hypothetical protein